MWYQAAVNVMIKSTERSASSMLDTAASWTMSYNNSFIHEALVFFSLSPVPEPSLKILTHFCSNDHQPTAPAVSPGPQVHLSMAETPLIPCFSHFTLYQNVGCLIPDWLISCCRPCLLHRSPTNVLHLLPDHATVCSPPSSHLQGPPSAGTASFIGDQSKDHTPAELNCGLCSVVFWMSGSSGWFLCQEPPEMPKHICCEDHIGQNIN